MFPKYKTHVCFVSHQSIPNLMLAFNEQTRPEKVYLLVSADMKENAKTLAQNFKNMKIAVEKVDLPSLSFKALKSEIAKFLLQLMDKEDMTSVAFNLTGGTKLMTLAADKVCSGLDIVRFYVDTKEQIITKLNDDQEYPMDNYVTVFNVLNSYGYKPLKREENTVQSKELITYFLENKKENIIELNQAYAIAEKGDRYDKKGKKIVNLIAKTNIDADTHPFFSECKKAKLLDYHDGIIGFTSEDTRSFCGGEWLEVYVGYILNQLKTEKKIDDYEQSLKVTFLDNKAADQNEQKSANELDALFVHNNILNVIECKTAKMDRSKNVRQYIDKLDAVCDRVGGILSKKIFISYLPVCDEGKKHAEKSNVIVIDDQKDIRNLRKTLIEIIQPKR